MKKVLFKIAISGLLMTAVAVAISNDIKQLGGPIFYCPPFCWDGEQ